ncbi:Arsenate-mycothiol transferase ArsC1 [Gulosibacter molinativorax]|nr:Arsenate-mycothiol transferase ArsC1 [Gulosibacter molinativorax]
MAVIADPTRARMLRLMRDAPGGKALVGALADSLELRQPTVSHHMKVLRDAGIVTGRREGRRVWYSITPEYGERVDALLGPALHGAGSRPDLERIIDDLVQRYEGVLSRETVAHYVRESYGVLTAERDIPRAASRTATFAAQRLDDLLRQEGEPVGPPEVLFVCVQNAGRSQMAAAILRQLAGDRVVVRTAGSAPGREVRTPVVAALDEIGVPVAGSSRSRSSTSRCEPPTLSSPWVAGMPAPCFRVGRISIGRSTTPRASRSTRCARFATRSRPECGRCCRC